MPFRTVQCAATAFAFLLSTPVGIALAQETDCHGEDLVAKLARDEPARYQRLLDHFATIENGEGIFWKIEKPGLQPSFLFGTAHTTDKRILARLHSIEPKLRQSRALIVEIADLSPDISRQMAIVQQYGMLPAGETLDSRLTEEERKLLGNATAAHGMPWFSARRMKASFLALTMSIPACAKIAMLRGDTVLDARLVEFARSNQIPVIGLETVDEQLALIGTLDEDTQLSALLEAVRSGSNLTEDIFETTIRLHEAGRIAMILSLMEVLKEDYPAAGEAMEGFEGPIIAERNIRMHRRALDEMEKGGVFMAVGALHLPGETGLVGLFRDSGFTVTRITGE